MSYTKNEQGQSTVFVTQPEAVPIPWGLAALGVLPVVIFLFISVATAFVFAAIIAALIWARMKVGTAPATTVSSVAATSTAATTRRRHRRGWQPAPPDAKPPETLASGMGESLPMISESSTTQTEHAINCTKVNTKAMKSKLFLLMILISQAGSAVAQMKADIVGLRLGMDVNETIAIIKAHAPSAQMTVLKERMPAPINTEFDALVVATTGTGDWQQPEAEMIVVSFSGPPSAPRAIDVHRVQKFGEGRQPLMGAVVSAIKRKYGEPNEERSGTATNRMMAWRTSATGQPIPAQVISGGLCLAPAGGGLSHADMTLPSIIKRHHSNGRLIPLGTSDPRCGQSLSVYVDSSQDRARPDTYFVHYIAVRVTDQVAWLKDRNEISSLRNGTHEVQKRAAAEAKQKAATRPAPKF